MLSVLLFVVGLAVLVVAVTVMAQIIVRIWPLLLIALVAFGYWQYFAHGHGHKVKPASESVSVLTTL